MNLAEVSGTGLSGRVTPHDLLVAISARSIPHFSYVEEADVTELHTLREHLTTQAGNGSAPLSLLPFILKCRWCVTPTHWDCGRWRQKFTASPLRRATAAAEFIQKIKELLDHPATNFMGG